MSTADSPYARAPATSGSPRHATTPRPASRGRMRSTTDVPSAGSVRSPTVTASARRAVAVSASTVACVCGLSVKASSLTWPSVQAMRPINGMYGTRSGTCPATRASRSPLPVTGVAPVRFPSRESGPLHRVPPFHCGSSLARVHCGRARRSVGEKRIYRPPLSIANQTACPQAADTFAEGHQRAHRGIWRTLTSNGRIPHLSDLGEKVVVNMTPNKRGCGKCPTGNEYSSICQPRCVCGWQC